MDSKAKKDINQDLKLTVNLDSKTYNCDLGKDLDIDQDEINSELADQPAKFAWYGMLSVLAKGRADVLENDAKTTEAEVTYNLFRQQSFATKEDKLTVDGVKALVKIDASYLKKMDTFLRAKLDAGMLQIAKAAFEQRANILVSISANKREEMTVDLHVNKEKVLKKMRNLQKGIEGDTE